MNQSTTSWTAPAPPASAIAAMVEDGRVHSRIYTDQTLFDLEIERIFGKTWIYVGHHSEVPKAGDYQTRTIGRTPVIMARGRDNQVRVLVNRCRHRGSQVVETESGNTKFFRCWYHGWTYDTSGGMVEITDPQAYGGKMNSKDMGLTPVPRVDHYRGFVFASLSPTGVSLAEHLGAAAPIIDLMVDASPTGEIFVDGGSHKTEYLGNWKLVGMDGYHPHYVHASVVAAWARNPESGVGSTHREDPFDDNAATLTRDFGHGHAMLDFRDHRIKHYAQHVEFLKKIKGGAEYVEAMHKAHGKERAELLISLGGDPHLGVFPNMQLIHNQVRIITPIAPAVTQVTMTAVRLGGVSDELNTERIRQHESFYGPAGAGSPDDAEIFERAQRGMQGEINPWMDISRGMTRETVGADGSTVGRITDEVTQRGQMKYWRQLMTSDA